MKSNAKDSNKRYNLLIKTIDRLERMQYTGGLGIDWCCDSITWLWKWRKITEEEMHSLCDRMVEIMKLY